MIPKLAKQPTAIPAPKHLRTDGRSHWECVLSTFAFDDHDLPLLQSACEQLDRAAEARAIVSKEGVTIVDRFGQKREHPAVATERAAHLAFVRIERELSLQIPPADSRPPPGRNYG
jgi:P27 family predicted phage terminase small subunit